MKVKPRRRVMAISGKSLRSCCRESVGSGSPEREGELDARRWSRSGATRWSRAAGSRCPPTARRRRPASRAACRSAPAVSLDVLGDVRHADPEARLLDRHRLGWPSCGKSHSGCSQIEIGAERDGHAASAAARADARHRGSAALRLGLALLGLAVLAPASSGRRRTPRAAPASQARRRAQWRFRWSPWSSRPCLRVELGSDVQFETVSPASARCHHLGKAADVDRLGDVAVEPRLERPLPVAAHRVRGQRQHPQAPVCAIDGSRPAARIRPCREAGCPSAPAPASIRAIVSSSPSPPGSPVTS